MRTDNIIELPKKLKTCIADTENAFVVRIVTEPRTTDTGIANIIPINRDISRQGRDKTIQIATHLVRCWNSHDALLAACKIGFSYIKAVTGKVPRPLQDLASDFKQVQQAIAQTE